MDDGVLTASTNKILNEISDKLDKALKVKWDTSISGLVGISITQTTNGYAFSQKDLILKLLGLNKSNITAKSPLPANCNLKSNKANELDKEYLQRIGMLLYIAQGLQPNICYAVYYLAQFSMATDDTHWQALEHLIAYLRGMLEDKIIISKEHQGTPNIMCYVDANWGEGNRSNHGFIIMHGRNLVSWKSKRQATVGASTVQAEYIALSFAARECLWLSNLFGNFLHNKTPLPLSDNRMTIGIAKECVSRKQTQHLIWEFNLINEYLVKKKPDLKWISTKDQLADILTKSIGPIATKTFTNLLTQT
ncbi:hypothetical protein O181_099555 [Austropuccinia psidii MF-1]|uniref:Reverse transcriptase Ty1/copia-type domain-containing protein n=1 Tax=Austropuccinia psidii MF-1 TaxID=1389203 RepID=A0A9Q3JDV4_9BASI|nr:hypothetical protein [Austropuccinia psidii MF-1]